MNRERTERRKSFIINLMFYGALIALTWIAFKYVLNWFMPFIIGFFIAALFRPAIRLLEKRIKIGKKGITLVVLLLGYAVLITLLTLLSLQIISLLKGLFTALPTYFDQMILPNLKAANIWIDSMMEVPPEWSVQIKSIQESLSNGLKNAISSLSTSGLTLATNFTKGVPGFFVSLVFTILASFFISFNYDKFKRFISYQLSDKVVNLVREVKETLTDSVLKYMRGYLIIMSMTFIELSIALTVLGVENSVWIAFGVAIFDIFPVFGTGGILIPWLLFELLGGNAYMGIGLLVTYGIITVIRNFSEPKIIGDQLGLNPIISIMSIYLGLKLIGVAGMILMPITVQIAISLHRKGVLKIYKDLPEEETPK